MDNNSNCRPWGHYEILSDKNDHKVKRIIVLPGKRLSLQKHKYRSEHWFIVAGKGTITLGDRNFDLSKGDSIDIGCGEIHRVENKGDSNLVFIEVQCGESFLEEDIERLEDDFGRV